MPAFCPILETVLKRAFWYFEHFCAFLTNCFAQSAHNFKVVFLIHRTTLWQEFMMQSKKTVSKTFTFNRTWRAFIDLGFSVRFHWDDWALVSMSLPYTYDSQPVLTFLSKSWSSLNVVNISWTMSMRHCFCTKFSNFGTVFAAARFMLKTSVNIAWHKPNDMPTSSATALIVIQRLLLQCF